jgi:hypothetical protein
MPKRGEGDRSAGSGGEIVSPSETASAMGEELLAAGVYGWRFDTPEGIYFPVISAARPGTGDVGRFLDALPKDRRVVFSTVMSVILRGMLLRRGFTDAAEFCPEFGEHVEIMAREAEVKS